MVTSIVGLPNVLNSLPLLPSGIAPSSLIDSNGGNWVNTYTCGTLDEARSVGIALRTHYSNSAGNGGPGNQIRIVTLSTTAGGVHHW